MIKVEHYMVNGGIHGLGLGEIIQATLDIARHTELAANYREFDMDHYFKLYE